MRFWTYEKKGFNRGNRVENSSWTYSGGSCLSLCANAKDLQPREYDGVIPFFMDKGTSPPPTSMMWSFDLVRVSIMPKNDDIAKKDKKTCFTLKSVGPTVRTLASVLPHLRDTMKRSKEEAEEETLKIIRGEAPYTDAKGNPLPYAHQVECITPKDSPDNYSMAEVSMCSFLQDDLGPETTFKYLEGSSVVRMYVKPTGCSPYVVDMPKDTFLKNANATDYTTACGLYTLAAHSKGALCAYVTHCRQATPHPPPLLTPTDTQAPQVLVLQPLGPQLRVR
jgi:hypothetical protein